MRHKTVAWGLTASLVAGTIIANSKGIDKESTLPAGYVCPSGALQELACHVRLNFDTKFVKPSKETAEALGSTTTSTVVTAPPTTVAPAAPGATPPTTAKPNFTPGTWYFLGDSLGMHGKDLITQAMAAKGWKTDQGAYYYDSVGCRPLVGNPGNVGDTFTADVCKVANATTGITQIDKDKDSPFFGTAQDFILELGTNDLWRGKSTDPAAHDLFTQRYTEAVATIRAHNAGARIILVNLFFSPNTADTDLNNRINTVAASDPAHNTVVADWFSQAADYYSGDAVHPSDYQAFADLIANTAGAPAVG